MFYLMYELKYKIKYKVELLYLYVFFVSLFFILGIAGEGLHPERFSGVLWALLLLSWLLSFSQFCQQDHEDGTFEQLQLSSMPMEWVMLAKLLVHGIVAVIPLSIIALAMGHVIGWKPPSIGLAGLILCVGGLQIGAIGLLASSLCVGLKRLSSILAIIVIPLIVPTILFGTEALNTISDNGEGGVGLLLLIAYATLTIPLSCIVAASALRNNY